MQLKKILIAGDSFAADKLKVVQSKNGHLGQEYSWPFLLKQKYNITNVAYPGASLSWTYKKIKDQDINVFDRIIVFVTAHCRLSMNFHDGFGLVNSISFPNYNTVLNRLKNYDYEKNNNFIEHIKWAKMYYEDYYDEDIALILHEALINKIIDAIPEKKLILIRCFQHTLPRDEFKIKFAIHEITKKEIQTNKSILLKYQETEKHINHMSIENKTIFAKMIEDLIEKDYTDITLDNFMQINPTDFDTYYTEK